MRLPATRVVPLAVVALAPLLLALMACAPACAAIRVQSATMELPGAKLTDVRASVAPGADGNPFVQLRAAHVSVPALGWKDVGLALSGIARRAGGNAWRMDGAVAVTRAPGGALSAANVSVMIDTDAGSLDVRFEQRKAAIRALLPLDQPSHVSVSLKGLPLAWLQGLLATAWKEGHLGSGTLNGELALDIAARGAKVSGRVGLADAGVDSRSGAIAAQQFGARGTFSLDTTGAATTFEFDGNLNGGQLLLGPIYAQLPSHAAQLQLSANAGADGIDIDSVHFNDGDALDLGGKVAFDAKGDLSSLQFDRFQAQLPQAYARYGDAWLATLGWKNLATMGSLSGSIAMSRGVPSRFALHADHVSVSDADGRLALDDLDGALDWDAQAQRPASTLSWRAFAFYTLPFGATRLRFQSDGGALTLATPAQLPLLDGQIALQQLVWRPAADKQDRINASFAVVGLDVAKLCKLFGWPQFPGTLGGAVPSLRYSGDSLAFDGGMSMHVFDGFVDVTRLTLQQPFGVAPVLSADVDMRQLDLGEVTSVFDFGSITGKLDGGIHGLKLVNWQPVAFDAALRADSGGRISQRALKSLTSVGGGGIAAGLQGLALNLFKTFGYSRIGLSCVLRAGVCTMGGIAPASGDDTSAGYTIVDGSGLPHISVIGHERQVDWATLVDRLKSATEGNGPVVK